MNNINFKKALPILAAIAIFAAITFGYFTPLLKGKVILQGDMVSVRGTVKEINDFRDKYHEEPLWTNSMFGGMPAYLISIKSGANVIAFTKKALMLGMDTTGGLVFMYMLGFFILLLTLGLNTWLSIVGAIAFAFTSYQFIIIEAGHITKAYAIGYMAPVFAGVILVFRKKYLLGSAVLALFTALELSSSHVQVTYYLVMLLAIYVAFEFYALFREKQFKTIGEIIGIFVIAGTLAFACNISNLLNTLDYAKYTIRGESELSNDKENKTSGLDRDYAVQWSLGKAETMSLLIPGFKGISSSISVGENKNALKDVDPQMRQTVASMPQYWGDQPFTAARYAGAIVIFLFVLGFFIVDTNLKWVLIIGTLLSMALSWGKNFMWLTNIFLDYLPGYNKFRAVSMILVIAEFCIPLLAMLAVDKLIKTPNLLNSTVKLSPFNIEMKGLTALITSFALTGGLCLVYYLMPDLTDFSGAADEGIFEQVAKSNGNEVAQLFMENVETARRALFKADALRSFFFILLGAAAVWLYMSSKINSIVLTVAVGLLILTDLWLVDKKFLNDSNFVSKNEIQIPFPETTADKAILEDTDPSYRVLNLAVNTFNDASTSYRHKSVGGYHAAKLRRYQDMIEHHITFEMQNIINTLRTNPTDSSLRATFAQQGVLNMLNSRYIVYNSEAPPLRNRYALGNAWFVQNYKWVKNPDEEIEAVGEINPATTAVIDEKFKPELENYNAKPDYSASILLTEYKPNHLTYQSDCKTEQLAVFSEIYYNDGWNAYVDGELKPHFRTNYILRGMRVPEGKHTIEFKFEPPKYYMRQKITMTSGFLLLGLVALSIFRIIKK